MQGIDVERRKNNMERKNYEFEGITVDKECKRHRGRVGL
jgi:hypothetical protein